MKYLPILKIIIQIDRCLDMLDNIPTSNDDQKKGVYIIRHALKQPAMQIAINAGAGM